MESRRDVSLVSDIVMARSHLGRTYREKVTALPASGTYERPKKTGAEAPGVKHVHQSSCRFFGFAREDDQILNSEIEPFTLSKQIISND